MRGVMKSKARMVAATLLTLAVVGILAAPALAKQPQEPNGGPNVDPSQSGSNAGHSLDATGGVLYNPNPYSGTASGNKNKFDGAIHRADMYDCEASPHKDDGFGVGCGVHNIGEFFKTILSFLDNPMAGILSFMMHTLSMDRADSPLGTVVSGKPTFLDSSGYTDNI